MSKAQFTIHTKPIGEGHPCFIIAEAGVNHNGRLSLAKKLIDCAKKAGADAVKFQTFKAEKLATHTTPKADYQKKTTPRRETHYAMLKKLELTEHQFGELKAYADKKKILFLSTPYDTESVELLTRLDIKAFKVSSADITNIPLLALIAKKRLPIIISTGMSTLGEVEEAIHTIDGAGNSKYALLQCNFNYPAKVNEINLRAMQTLKQAFQVPVGYSDHTEGIEVAIAAVALGACIIEKHLTLDKDMPGPDHKASADATVFTTMVKGIRNIEKSLGSSKKYPTPSENHNRQTSRRSLTAAVTLPQNTTIQLEHIAIKRPGTGIPPKYLNEIVGSKTTETISADELISWKKIRL